MTTNNHRRAHRRGRRPATARPDWSLAAFRETFSHGQSWETLWMILEIPLYVLVLVGGLLLLWMRSQSGTSWLVLVVSLTLVAIGVGILVSSRKGRPKR